MIKDCCQIEGITRVRSHVLPLDFYLTLSGYLKSLINLKGERNNCQIFVVTVNIFLFYFRNCRLKSIDLALISSFSLLWILYCFFHLVNDFQFHSCVL